MFPALDQHHLKLCLYYHETGILPSTCVSLLYHETGILPSTCVSLLYPEAGILPYGCSCLLMAMAGLAFLRFADDSLVVLWDEELLLLRCQIILAYYQLLVPSVLHKDI